MTWSSAHDAEKTLPRKRKALAALDLGTNNCRLMIAVPRRRGFAVVATFSRIVRLGEGLSTTGKIAPEAQDRAIEALKICAEMIARWDVAGLRCVATEACRAAKNGAEFVQRVRRETGLKLDVIDSEQEAHFALAGCSSLIDPEARKAMLFDIGGGSTELCFLDVRGGEDQLNVDLRSTSSLPFGVVRLSEGLAAGGFSGEHFRLIRARVAASVREVTPANFFESGSPADHLIGTSGTSTSLAAFHMGLKKYRRRDVDGSWLARKDIHEAAIALEAMGLDARAAQPAIGSGRADLIMPGCAVLLGILDASDVARVRVADRGLREGIITALMKAQRSGAAPGTPGVSTAKAAE